MFSRTLALLIRSLRVDAVAALRLFRLVFAAFICLNLADAMSSRVVGRPGGLLFFKQMAYLNFIILRWRESSFFAWRSPRKKEERNAGLLKTMTSVPWRLLGKSTSRLMTALLLLLIQLPFALLAITLGA